jgi:hypothetical protein
VNDHQWPQGQAAAGRGADRECFVLETLFRGNDMSYRQGGGGWKSTMAIVIFVVGYMLGANSQSEKKAKQKKAEQQTQEVLYREER